MLQNRGGRKRQVDGGVRSCDGGDKDGHGGSGWTPAPDGGVRDGAAPNSGDIGG